MRTKSILGLLICIALVSSLSFAQPANAASAEEEVLQVMTNFVKAQNANDSELMASLWWNSPKTSTYGPPKNLAFLTQGWDSIVLFFKDLNKYPLGSFSRTLHNPQVTMLGDTTAIATAYSVFTQNPPVVKEQTISQERMTFVLQKIGGKWVIVHGHGSALPTE
jgi:uncharacterized protein (TIGR02246 family)